ncbi:MAG TPA: dihydropteroate synthase [bacterium]|nr:dihydropteroate synthase [bacterium]
MIRLDRTVVMGILNVTPDSFSDGGAYLKPAQAVAQGIRMARDGAAIIDVGGESTRPGSLPVDAAEELSRVIPVIRRLRAKSGVALSIDTTKAIVADEALKSGACIINDTSALEDDPRMIDVARAHGCPVIIMHRQGMPRTMQRRPRYDDAPRDIAQYLKKRISYLVRCGIKLEDIIVDPGICFGKSLEHNVQIINELRTLCRLGRPVAIGVSRKSFIGKLLGGIPTHERLAGSLAAAACAVINGARIVRAHDVKETADLVRVIDGIRERS